MSEIKSTGRPSLVRVSIIPRPGSVRVIKSFNLAPEINVTKVRRFYSFSKENTADAVNEAHHSRHVTHTKLHSHNSIKQSIKNNEIELVETETLEDNKWEMNRKDQRESIKTQRVIVTKIPRQQSQKEARSNRPTATAINDDIKLPQQSSLSKNEIQLNTENQNGICNMFSNDSTARIDQVLLYGSLNNQNSRPATNLNNEKNALPRRIESISCHESERFKEKAEHKRQRYLRCTCCPCSPCCAAISVFIALLLLAALAALIVTLIGMNKKTSTIIITTSVILTTTTSFTTITSTTMTTTSVTTTATTMTTTSVTTTATTMTTTSVTTSTTQSTTTSVTTTATTSTTTSATTTTTSTTTTVFTCGKSCLNQSWIDSSGGLAWWPFDGTYVDVTSGHNGIPSSYLPPFVTGYFGQAASFNVSAKQAMFTSFIPLTNVSFTVEAWIKPTGYPNPTDFSIVGLCPSQTTNYCLHINIRSKKLYFGFFYNDCKGGTTIALNQWIHTGFVFDVSKKTQTIYLNGVQDGQATVSSALLVQSGNFTVGINEGVVIPDNYFQGYIDELSINQRAKSSCEILERATLAAQFNFDTTSPYTDSGPNAVATTSSNTSIITGYKNEAISFTGSSSSYFQTWGFTSLGISNQAFSVTLWIQPQILSGTLVHLSTSSSGTGSTCFPLLGFAANGAIVAQVLTSNTTVMTTTGPILFASSSWIPIVQTWSSTNGLKLYVNNTLVSSVAASTFLGSETTPNYLTLGNCLSGCGVCSNGLMSGAGPFTGAIDDWRIYNRELSWSDVCALYFSV